MPWAGLPQRTAAVQPAEAARPPQTSTGPAKAGRFVPGWQCHYDCRLTGREPFGSPSRDAARRKGARLRRGPVGTDWRRARWSGGRGGRFAGGQPGGSGGGQRRRRGALCGLPALAGVANTWQRGRQRHGSGGGGRAGGVGAPCGRRRRGGAWRGARERAQVEVLHLRAARARSETAPR